MFVHVCTCVCVHAVCVCMLCVCACYVCACVCVYTCTCMCVCVPTDVLNLFKPTNNSARKLVKKVFEHGGRINIVRRDVRAAKAKKKVICVV